LVPGAIGSFGFWSLALLELEALENFTIFWGFLILQKCCRIFSGWMLCLRSRLQAIHLAVTKNQSIGGYGFR
jgi:hypothetical protein